MLSRPQVRTIRNFLKTLPTSTLVDEIYADLVSLDTQWLEQKQAAFIANEIVRAISSDRQLVIELAGLLEEKYPARLEDLSGVRALANQLQALETVEAADPCEEVLICSEPMVNRSHLRRVLGQLINNYNHGVIYISGTEGSGRSHSWHLIRHVASKQGVPSFLVPFRREIENRTLSYLYQKLSEAYELGQLPEPESDGGTVGDTAGKYVEEIASRLCNATGATRWIVIDFSVDVPDLAVPEFLRELCTYRDQNFFQNCVIFILGPTEHEAALSSLSGMVVERLDGLTEEEVAEAAKSINARGSQPLDEWALNSRIAAISADFIAAEGQARGMTARDNLRKLRLDVGAR